MNFGDQFPAPLTPTPFDALLGLRPEGCLEAWRALKRSTEQLQSGRPPLRQATRMPEPVAGKLNRAAQANPQTDGQALECFRTAFDPCRIGVEGDAFFTGYYEPEIEGSLCWTPRFEEPILCRPSDLETFPVGEFPIGEPFSAGRRKTSGELEPYPTREEIENGALSGRSEPIVWVRDAIEAFMIHVQGSARIRLSNGATVRLTYDGRNGRPYASLGALLIRSGRINPDEMSLERLKACVREMGVGSGQAGRKAMWRNESFIFFKHNVDLRDSDGPIGAASVSLAPLSSIAIDRTIWPYGLPYWIGAAIPARDDDYLFRIVIGQDTGSAIIGAARSDIFFGWGADAGRRAGNVRRKGSMFVLLPR